MRYTIVVTVVGLVATALAAPQGRSDGNPFGGNPFGGNPLGGNPLGGNPLGSADACYCCPGAFSNPASGECAALNSQTDTGVYCADYEIVMCCSADGGVSALPQIMHTLNMIC